MSDKTLQSSSEKSDSRGLLIHDLRGPMLNAKAFNTETEESVTRLCELLSDPARTITAEERVQISEILAVDLVPCIDYVGRALVQMEGRLEKYKNSQES